MSSGDHLVRFAMYVSVLVVVVIGIRVTNDHITRLEHELKNHVLVTTPSTTKPVPLTGKVGG